MKTLTKTMIALAMLGATVMVTASPNTALERVHLRWQVAPPERIGVSVCGPDGPGVLTFWCIETRGPSGEHRACVLSLGVGNDGKRSMRLERAGTGLFARPGQPNGALTAAIRKNLLHEKVEPMLERELQHREIVPEGGSYAAKLIGWVEVGAS